MGEDESRRLFGRLKIRTLLDLELSLSPRIYPFCLKNCTLDLNSGLVGKGA